MASPQSGSTKRMFKPLLLDNPANVDLYCRLHNRALRLLGNLALRLFDWHSYLVAIREGRACSCEDVMKRHCWLCTGGVVRCVTRRTVAGSTLFLHIN